MSPAGGREAQVTCSGGSGPLSSKSCPLVPMCPPCIQTVFSRPCTCALALLPLPNTVALCPTVAINLIVQHIQDILNGGLSKRQTNGYLNGYTPSRKRQASESSSRPH